MEGGKRRGLWEDRKEGEGRGVWGMLTNRLFVFR